MVNPHLTKLTFPQKEIFVYDRELLTSHGSSNSKYKSTRTVPAPFVPSDPPDVLADEANLSSWQELFKERRSWATRLSQDSDAMIGQINECCTELDVICRGTATAAENVKQHIGALHVKFEEARQWADEVLKDQEKLLVECDRLLNKYGAVRIHESLGRLFVGSDLRNKRVKSSGGSATFSTLCSMEAVNAARVKARDAIGGLKSRLGELQSSYEEILHDGNELSSEIASHFRSADDETSQLISNLTEELETVVKQISADYESTLTAPNSSRTVASVSKTALLHTRKFLPTLSETVIDIGDLYKRTVERRNSVEEMALGTLQRIASVQSDLAAVQSLIRSIDLTPEDGQALDSLGRVSQIPYIYASLLVESVRRQEWNQKMMADSSTLAEEMATYKDEEERRRKKWVKSVGDFLYQDALISKTRSFEISVQGQEENWPLFTRDDIVALIGDLEQAKGFEDLLKEISEWLKSLDVLSKQQAKRMNAFRKGAITDSMYGRSSLLLRGDDEFVQSLQNEKSKLEDRLRGAESRVRKLEDLLHRSTQMNRPFPGSQAVPSINANQPSLGIDRNGSVPGVTYATSPKANDLNSRRSSLASHRVSLADGSEEARLVQRVVQLEAELANERNKSTKFEESALRQVNKQDELKAQIQEAAAMKKDLMDNFGAQQHEFDAERRLLEDENRKFKVRIDEMEEDFDRLLGSHDNARAVFDERARANEAEVDKIREEASVTARKAEDELGNLQAVKENQSNRLDMLESSILKKDNEILNLERIITDLRKNIHERDEAQLEHQRALISAHSILDPDAGCSYEFDVLARDLEVLAQKAADHQRQIQLALENAQADNDALDSHIKSQERQVSNLRQQLANEEGNAFAEREEASAAKGRYAALEEELRSEREALLVLQGQYSSSETGSEGLRARLADEEQTIQQLRTDLASLEAASGEHNKELARRQSLIESLQFTNDSIRSHFHERGRRAGEVSLQLYLLTDRLTRLLEHIGYSIFRQNDAMVVQRISRSASAGNNTTEVSQAMNRSLSGPMPTAPNEQPPEYLHWALSDNAEQEHQQFVDFIHESKAFDLDAFSEAVVKRVKDTEHIARKWQREAKSYRDKFRGSQFEAQHKIAFRSFKEGDLALFLPTRSQAPQRSWAAFNVGAPHYFLREQEFHQLNSRDWLLARISRVEDRVVDLSKGVNNRASTIVSDDGASVDDDNPFGLSDGLRWYYLDATEENLGAPIALGPAKTTVARADVKAEGNFERKKSLDQGAATRNLAKSLDSRRSSANSKRSIAGAASSPAPTAVATFENISTPTTTASVAEPGTAAELKPTLKPGVIPEEVRRDQLLDP